MRCWTLCFNSIPSTTPSTIQSTHSFLDTAGIYTGDETKTIRGSVWLSTRLLESHSTVPCMAGSTRRIVGSPLSLDQTREVACTKVVLPQVIARGLNVTEVAHDYQSTIKTYVEQLGKDNSYDTWHGMNVAKEMKKICAGPVKARVCRTFRQARCTEVYSASNPDILCKVIMNGHHLNCHLESRCHQPGYHPKRKILTMPEAIKAYEDALRRTLIYRFAESFCRCRCTFWMESFNHQLLPTCPRGYTSTLTPLKCG
ncbi:hypothetical protein EMCRGX_G004292 [Ephydatia muelleri]